MDLLSIWLMGLGLAMDCFAVSVTQGLGVNRQQAFAKGNRPLLMALLFGLFQGGMPLIGYEAGSLFSTFFSRFAPWIALVLLAIVGGKMIWESTRHNDPTAQGKTTEQADFTLKHLLVLAVATSIDALVTGVIFIPCPERVWVGIGIIAFVSFVMAMAGYSIGVFIGTRFRMNTGLVGGIILVGLGLKIWLEGVCF